MAKFKITWPNGKSEKVEQSDCETVEQYINCRFGRGVKSDAKVTLIKPKSSSSEKTEE